MPFVYFSLSDHDIVWKYVEWVLERDEKRGVRVSVFKSNFNYENIIYLFISRLYRAKSNSSVKEIISDRGSYDK